MDISQGDEHLSGLDNCLTQHTTTQNKTKHIEQIKINQDKKSHEHQPR